MTLLSCFIVYGNACYTADKYQTLWNVHGFKTKEEPIQTFCLFTKVLVQQCCEQMQSLHACGNKQNRQLTN
jgi:hypothetical protein